MIASGKAYCSAISCRLSPPRSSRNVPEHFDYGRYWNRKLKQQRRIAIRFDKTIFSFGRFFNLAAVRLWLRSFVNTA